MSEFVLPVILCGGSGTRLWPLSRASLPKQFAPLLSGRSLLAGALERAAAVARGVRVDGVTAVPARGAAAPNLPEVICVANEEHRFLVADECLQAGVNGRILLEPAGRNTAAAMGCAALLALAGRADPDAMLLFLPADHYVPDVAEFCATITEGLAAARDGWFVTFGVVPEYPATAYGYIARGDAIALSGTPGAQGAQGAQGARATGGAYEVRRFVEKPDAARAAELIAGGDHWWNAGIFLVRAQVLLDALAEHAGDIRTAVAVAMQSTAVDGSFVRPERERFLEIRSESIDYAVLEHHNRISVVPFSGSWSDVGSWNAVAALTPADENGNRSVGNTLALDCASTYLHSQNRVVVGLGLQNILVVDTTDALLVASADQAERVKDVVAALRARGLPVATQHRRVARPWGEYDSIDAGERFQVKRITVKPGESLSLQLHHHRAEHWIVVRGTARVTRGDQTFLLSENESTYIPLGTIHRLENPGRVPLEMIEVQSGSYLGEDDIVRFEDTYGRVPQTATPIAAQASAPVASPALSGESE